MRRKGFTLIELLIVIAIIAILAAILWPVYQKITIRGRVSRVISNLHQIATASHQYQDDYNGYYVPAFLVMNPPLTTTAGAVLPDGPDGMMGCSPPRVTGVLSWRLLEPYTGAKQRKIFDYEPFGGGKCQGWGWGGYKVVPNVIVHGRNLWGRGLGPKPVETGNFRMGTGYGTADFDWWSGGGISSLTGIAYPGYWKDKDTKEIDPVSGLPIKGTFGSWSPTLQDKDVNFPNLLISWSHCVRAIAMEPSSFIWRGTFHESYTIGMNGSPLRNTALGNTTFALFCDGHVQTSNAREDFAAPVMWNNSPNADGGGWNRNRSATLADDIYHGLEPKNDPKYPSPNRRYTGWIAVADQLCSNYNDPAVAGVGGLGGVGYYYHSGYKETTFDVELTYGDYNTVERPDPKFDETS